MTPPPPPRLRLARGFLVFEGLSLLAIWRGLLGIEGLAPLAAVGVVLAVAYGLWRAHQNQAAASP